MPITNEEANRDEVAKDVDESDFERGLMDNVIDEDDDEEFVDLGGDLTGDDIDDLIFGFKQDQDIRLSTEDLDAFFDNVNDVAQSAMETEGVSSVLQVTPPTLDEMADTTANLDTTSRIPPLLVATLTSLPSESDLILTQSS